MGKILNIMTAVLAGIAAISLLVGGIGIIDISSLCKRRAQEIGIRGRLAQRTGIFIAVSDRVRYAEPYRRNRRYSVCGFALFCDSLFC